MLVKTLGEIAKLTTGGAPGLDLVIYGVVLIVMVWLAPGGLMGLFSRLRLKKRGVAHG
jgi:branched-chain amino acid transport system permease protein